MSLMRAILDDPPPPIEAVRSDVDPNLAAVINRAMSRDGRANFRTAPEMRSALAGVAAPSRPPTKVLAQPMGPSTHYLVAPRSVRRPMTRRRKLILAAAALVGLLVAAFRTGARPIVDHPATGAGQQQHRRAAAAATAPGEFTCAVTGPRSGRRRAARSPRRRNPRRNGNGNGNKKPLIAESAGPEPAVTIRRVTDNSEQAVLVEQRDRIPIITIDRPEAKNAVNAEVSRGLADAVDRLDGDAGCRSGS